MSDSSNQSHQSVMHAADHPAGVATMGTSSAMQQLVVQQQLQRQQLMLQQQDERQQLHNQQHREQLQHQLQQREKQQQLLLCHQQQQQQLQEYLDYFSQDYSAPPLPPS